MTDSARFRVEQCKIHIHQYTCKHKHCASRAREKRISEGIFLVSFEVEYKVYL